MGLLAALERMVASLGFNFDADTFFVVFGLGFTRIVTAVVLTPFFGGQTIPGQVKVGLSAIIMALIYPQLATPNMSQFTTLIFIGLLLKEALIGATIGIVAQLVFYAVQMAGTLIDTQRGMNQITYLAPQLPGHTSALGQLKFQAALVLFFVMNGHLLFIRTMADSFAVISPFSFPQLQAGVIGLMEHLIRLTAQALVIAVQLAAPVLLAIFLVDLSFASLGKVASQVNTQMESQPVKALVGLAVLFIGISYIFDQLKDHLLMMLRDVSNLVQMLS